MSSPMKTHSIWVAAILTLLLSASPVDAQDQWRLTPYLTTGDFATELVPAGTSFETAIFYDDIIGHPGTIVPDTVGFAEGYGFDIFTGFGASLMWRRGHVGIEGSLTWIPTRAVAQTPDSVRARVARAFGFAVPPELEDDAPFPAPGRLKTPQNLLIPTIGVTYFTEEWQPGRPPPIWEFYFAGEIGIVSYLDDEPLLAHRDDSWDTPILGAIGVGVQLNFTQSLLFRVDLRDRFWSTEVMSGESKWQHMISFSPGVTFVL